VREKVILIVFAIGLGYFLDYLEEIKYTMPYCPVYCEVNHEHKIRPKEKEITCQKAKVHMAKR
jgi:hypothetical protein